MPAHAPPSFPREAVAACVERILRSPHFSRSARLGRFLRFTVELALGGRTDELKERTIGVEVYGRDLEYDPRADPIVRSEAHRLRARLGAYYAREGATDPVVIEYPKGGYVPRFRPGRAVPTEALKECRLVVAAFEDRGEPAAARAMGEALAAQLAGRPGLHVLYPAWGRRDLPRATDHLEVDYAVEGSFEREGASCVVTVRVVRLADAREIWSHGAAFPWEQRARLQEALAARIAGAIGAALTPRSTTPRPAGARAYELFVKGRHSVIQYGNSVDTRHLQLAEQRLHAALQLEPDFCDALAELGHLTLLQLYPPRGETATLLETARAYLERALALDPRHARSLYLLGHVEGTALHPREGLRLTETAVAIDPDDAEARTLLAARYASLGFWESAVAACDWALALDPVWSGPYSTKCYCLTQMGEHGAAREAIDAFARAGTSPTEATLARCNLDVAKGDFTDAEAALACPESTFALRRDLAQEQEIAWAVVQALRGETEEARRVLEARRGDPPRFRDDLIRLALALGEEALALDLIARNPINRNYRWLARQAAVRPYLQRPGWRSLLFELHAAWQRDLEEVGPRLPAPPPELATPRQLLRESRAPRARAALASQPSGATNPC